MKLIRFLFILFISLNKLSAQDPIFSQYYASPLEINPAFAGLSESPRFGANYRNQWPLLDNSFKTYVTYAMTYDQFYRKLNSGLGLQILGDEAGDGLIKNVKITGIYGYRLEVSDDNYIKGGLELSYVNYHYGWDKFQFGDQLDPQFGAISPGGTPYPTEEIRPDKTNVNYVDLGTGLLYYSPLYYFGVGIKHINTPQNSILNINQSAYEGIPVRWTFHGGFQFDLTQRGRPRRTLSPSLLIAKQSKFFQVNGGFQYDFSKVFTGLWYRHSRKNPDALIALIGFKKDPFKFAYSFDYTLSDLGIGLGGSHEISILLSFKSEKHKKSDTSDCFEAFR